ncbi:MAG: MarR family transcriptional regulator [Pseudomonadota bacterium]
MTDLETVLLEREAAEAEEDLRLAMLARSPLVTAYRLNYVANSFVAGLYGKMEEETGISRAQFVVLLCLSVRDGCTAQEIADATHRPKNSLSRAVRALEAAGHIHRSTDVRDQRRQPLQMTPSGRRIFTQVRAQAEAREAEMLASLSAEEAALLSKLLNRIAQDF